LAPRYRIRERVRWSDVDTSGIIRWDAYTRFVELAETELFRAVGYPYETLWQKLDLWLPRVQFHLDMRAPARLDELLETEIRVARIGRSSIRLEFAVRNGRRVLAEGHLVMAAIRGSSGSTIAVPTALARALAGYRAR
jgi:YbgC/YbaW family acyl-CoA thioester hydrolase